MSKKSNTKSENPSYHSAVILGILMFINVWPQQLGTSQTLKKDTLPVKPIIVIQTPPTTLKVSPWIIKSDSVDYYVGLKRIARNKEGDEAIISLKKRNREFDNLEKELKREKAKTDSLLFDAQQYRLIIQELKNTPVKHDTLIQKKRFRLF